MNTSLWRLTPLVVVVLAAAAALAQWPEDPAANLPVGYGPGEQTVPHVAVVPGNGAYARSTWVGWYDNASGNYDVAVQLLAPGGEPLLPAGGLVVSDEPQESWVMDWSLAAHADGNAALAFADVRDGDSNIQVYLVSPLGDLPWGENGIAVTDDSDFKGPPCVTFASDGDVVVAWMESGATSELRMQRFAPDGTARLAFGGVVVSEASDLAPAGNLLVPSVDGDVILGWVPSYSFMGSRQIKAQRFDAAGAPVWGAFAWVMDDASLPMGHYFKMTPDGTGGALFAWDLAVGLSFDVRVQRLTADGVEMHGHNGLNPEAGGPAGQIEPAAVFDPATGEITLVYVDMTSTQNERGLYAQRFDLFGNRLWGEAGTILLPRDSDMESLPALAFADGLAVGFVEQDSGGAWATEVLLGFALAADGGFLWDGPVAVATTPSNKGDLLAAYNGQTVVAVWDEDRNGNPDVFAQNLNLDGTLGPGTVAIEDDHQDGGPAAPPAAFAALPNVPNPFNPSTTIAFDLPAAGPVTLRVFDARGALVRTLIDATLPAAHHTAVWNGIDDAGRSLPSGVYYYHLATETRTATRPMTLLK